MARAPKSQWEFGDDLFKPSEIRAVLSVTDLTLQVKRVLEKGFTSVWIRGEISNYRMQASGHAYFVLKDANSQLGCVLFRGQGGAQRSALRDGASVVLGGDVTVYEPRGQYQLRVTQVEAEGLGALQAAFERLKQKLAAEGLFDPARKRPIPAFPRRIGIVTSPTGAALQDVLHVIERRFAALPIVLVPVRVQGAGAGAEIAAAVARLNSWREQSGVALDVILVTRGGGSLEDLWAFNEEIVARAIAASAVPVVSAVGHEIDFTIADFVADLRAATPSAAAEILTADYVASARFVAVAVERMRRRVHQALGARREEMDDCRRRLHRVHPRRRLEAQAQYLDELGEQLRRRAGARWREQSRRIEGLRRRLVAQRPGALLIAARRNLDDLQQRLQQSVRLGLKRQRQRIVRAESVLRLLAPENVLERGYSITLDPETGRVIRDAGTLAPGRRLRTRLARGEVSSVATQVQPAADVPE